jgi:thioester reductase-like protein
MSSSRVSLLSGNPAPLPLSVAKFPPPADGSEGYTSSKWASEVFLENLATGTKGSGLSVEVHRPCVVVGDQAPHSDALNAILRYSALLRTVPNFAKADGYFDFKNVEMVSKDIAEAAIAATLRRPGVATEGIVFRHHSSGAKVPVKAFKAHMEKIHGVKYEEADIGTWMELALEAGIDPLITTYLEGLVEKGVTITFPYLGETAA